MWDLQILDTVLSKADCPGSALSVLSTGSSKTVVTVQIGKLGTSRFSVLYHRYLYVLVFLAAKALLSQARPGPNIATLGAQGNGVCARIGMDGVSMTVLGVPDSDSEKEVTRNDCRGQKPVPDTYPLRPGQTGQLLCSLRLAPTFVRPIHLNLSY
jgi:hypothetical protein